MNEYLGNWTDDDEYNKAQLLWLWYDYYTETYDRSLWGTVPSKHDETMVVFKSCEARCLANKNAERVRKEIYAVAEQCNINNEVMMKAKNDSFRGRMKMQGRLETFVEYEKQGKFSFIYKLIN